MLFIWFTVILTCVKINGLRSYFLAAGFAGAAALAGAAAFAGAAALAAGAALPGVAASSAAAPRSALGISIVATGIFSLLRISMPSVSIRSLILED